MNAGIVIRDLTSVPEYRQVMALEREIRGSNDPDDAVGLPMFVVTIKRGGILLGAYDAGRMVAFAYSLAGLKHGKPMQWSHMLGVHVDFRGAGLGRALKFAQRQRALAMGLDLMEWTYDPLQAPNAHLNFRGLGVVAEEYHVDVYGESSSILHRGSPTDRLIAQWWLAADHVERAAGGAPIPIATVSDGPGALVLTAGARDGWIEPLRVELGRRDPVLTAEIPGDFTRMLEAEPGLASAWRLATREVFTHYLARGYRVVDFERDARAGGRYVLTTGTGHPSAGC